MSLVSGIIVLIIGVILAAISSAIPAPGNKIAYWIGIALIIIGIIIIVLAVLGLTLGGLFLLPLLLV